MVDALLLSQELPAELCLMIHNKMDILLRQELHQELLEVVSLADPDSSSLGWLSKNSTEWFRSYSWYDHFFLRNIQWGRWKGDVIRIGHTDYYTSAERRFKNCFHQRIYKNCCFTITRSLSCNSLGPELWCHASSI